MRWNRSNLDGWQGSALRGCRGMAGMTERERLERHVSLAQVERTAAEYHCSP
jgi:hypothetical protein